jgi:hypothetical protein
MSSNINGQPNGLYSYESFSQGKKNDSNFLWWCSGAHQQILAKYPSEHVKYSGLGGVLLATFALAGISAGYALYSIFHSLIAAVVFGILWGVIIFNFDRFLVSTMRKYGVSPNKQFQMAIPRIVLALLIGVTIARPLELKIFEKEIDIKVADNMHKKILTNDSLLRLEEQQFIATATAEKNRLLERQGQMQDTLFRLQAEYVKEADGTGGSGKRGIEQLTRLKMDAFQKTSNEFAPELQQINAGIKKQDSIISSIHSSIDKKRKEYEAGLRANVGFLERNKALSDLSDEEPSVFWANLLLSLLIILIETGPILSKLIMQAGPYDIALAEEELTSMADSENRIRKSRASQFEKEKQFYQHKLNLSETMIAQLNAVQKRKIQEAFDRWEKGESDPYNRPPLKDFLAKLKKELEVDEGGII